MCSRPEKKFDCEEDESSGDLRCKTSPRVIKNFFNRPAYHLFFSTFSSKKIKTEQEMLHRYANTYTSHRVLLFRAAAPSACWRARRTDVLVAGRLILAVRLARGMLWSCSPWLLSELFRRSLGLKAKAHKAEGDE